MQRSSAGKVDAPPEGPSDVFVSILGESGLVGPLSTDKNNQSNTGSTPASNLTPRESSNAQSREWNDY
eukprot:ANDGO_03111.mRNA.1 hypothetical protein